MGLRIAVRVQRQRSTELVVLSAIGVEECANHLLARGFRPIGLGRELRHRSPLSLLEDPDEGRGVCVTFP
jgi:hypothetical protein